MSKKIFLVTGANKGLGKETVRQLAAKGNTVYLGARKESEGQKTVKELQSAGDVRFVHLDLNDEKSLQKAAEQIKAESGYLDGLVNNAGINPAYDSATTTTLDSLRKAFETNYFGTVMVTQAMLPLLKAGKHKVIVNVSSGLGSTTMHGDPNWPFYGVTPAAYNSSKAALNHYTVLLAKELRAEGFRVNAINPGWIATDMGGADAPGKVEDGAAISVLHALAGPDAPTGLFITTGGTIAW